MDPAVYTVVLQERLQITDHEWHYSLPNLPNPASTDKAGLIKSCHLHANSVQQNLTLSFTNIASNRAIAVKPLSKFIHFTCSNFRLQYEDGKSATFRESVDYIAKLLKSGIHLNGIHYSFYGHSNSQLKSRSCFLLAGSQEEVDKEVDTLGDFTMKTVAKKAKRIGLLFSSAHAVVNVKPVRCRDISDVERESYTFTDGCGNISPVMARLLAQKMPIIFRNKKYHPSVFQIRYRGYKGVVSLEPKLEPQIWLEFRKSMKKFSGGLDLSFSVVDYSKPFTYGYLNDDVMLLLHALGIETSVLQRKQQEYFDLLTRARTDPIVAFRFLHSIGESELAEKILVEGIELCQTEVQRFVSRERGKMMNKRNMHKSRIFIKQSRLLFGVCDNRGVLQEGECYVKPTMDEDGVPHALTGSYILVTRNPCLHPGDIQKLRVVAQPELAHLVDCIVFPVQGRRPAADMMSGGDLDGDKFFVCWDKDLIPVNVTEPAEYPGPKEPVQLTKITTADRIDHFARSSSMQLGQINNLYMKWARYRGPLSSQCQELNRLFSQCVDSSRIAIPDRLKDVPEPPAGSDFVLDALHTSAARYAWGLQKLDQITHLDSIDRIVAVLAEPIGYSQFELIQNTLRWCQKHHCQLEEFWYLFDSTQLSSEEKTWLITQLPARKYTPELILSDLLYSDLLSSQELSLLGLRGAHIRWKLTYASSSDRLANLLDICYRILPIITRKLLVLKIHDRFSVAVYLSTRVPPEDEFLLGSSSRVFAIPHGRNSFDASRIVVPTKQNSRLYYDHRGFQLYEGKRANTFVFIARSATDEKRWLNARGQGNRARIRQKTIEEGVNQEWRASIALNKFSQGLATSVGRLWREGIAAAELYVISNSDQRSFRNLDLWLEQVDTDQVIENFGAEPIEADIDQGLDNLDLSNELETVRILLKEEKLESLAYAATEDISRALQLAWQSSSHDLVNRLFAASVKRLTKSLIDCAELVTILVHFLHFAPTMVVYFVQLSPWSDLEPSLNRELDACAYLMLRALILCTNRMRELALDYLGTLLAEIKELSIENLRCLTELIALTIQSPETAFDILVERLEPSTGRMVRDSPKRSQYLMSRLSAIALDHIEEAVSEVRDSRLNLYKWQFHQAVTSSEGFLLECDYRIDAPVTTRLATGDHIRFVCVQCPESMFVSQIAAFEALVEKFEVGKITLRCLRYPPAIYKQCLWQLEHCGSFVTSQTMMDAVTKLVSKKEACCTVYKYLMENHPVDKAHTQPSTNLSELNSCQQIAVLEALQSPVTCIWGPPGTGKTHTIVAIINEIIEQNTSRRLLVTAPTHNAVDNILRRYLKSTATHMPVRVSTDVQKVCAELRAYTCDAMLGKDINQNPGARRKAQKQIAKARLVFTTCVGAGLGLLRGEHFDDIIIDEASQQTEPASLVPIVKGCSRLVLVGDHVQLRATVQLHATALAFDMSLFESLWIGDYSVSKVMLETQYRMHPNVCRFPSDKFYEGRLLSAAHCEQITIAPSMFAWPESSRMVFVQSSAPEDLGRASKSNAGQAKVCQVLMSQLRETSGDDSYSIALLTPYKRQVELLKQELPGEIISSIDGFQGQEADVVVYVSVRCNERGEIGFLKDMRRLNVALTRARAGVIIIGDEATLIGKHKSLDQHEQSYHATWKQLIEACHKVEITRPSQDRQNAHRV